MGDADAGSTGAVSVWSDALDQASAIRFGTTTAGALTEAYLRRITDLDPTLRAYVTVDADRARAAAAETDERVRRGNLDDLPAFAGVMMSIKDNVDVAGLPTTHSSKALADHVAAADAPIVRRLRDAGFVILGKSNLSEFCTSMTSSELNGICRNPWDTERTPAGSSGGAGVALGAGLCAVAHGTDGAGSVRAPASYCGVIGLKPSRGLVSFGPEEKVTYFGTSVDGVLSRSVRDAASVLDVMVDTAGRSPAWSPRPPRPYAESLADEPELLRIAVCSTYPIGDIDPECVAAVDRAAGTLARLGHDVVEAAPDWMTILSVAAGPMSVPGPAALVGLDQLDQLEPRNRPVIESGTRLSVIDHARWTERVLVAAAVFRRFWDEYDVLVSPVSGMLPPSVSWAPWDQTPEQHMATFATFPNFAHPFNLSGQPAISLPLAWSTGGLPIGIQLAGRALGETPLLRLAAQLEQACPWDGHRPPDVG